MSKVVGDIAVTIGADISPLQKGMKQGSAEIVNFGERAEAMGRKIKSAESHTNRFSGAMGRLRNVSNRTRAQIQNTSFQLQDIAVQLQGGTKASTAFAQQLPQLAGAFGPVGAVIGVLAGVGIPALAFALGDMTSKATEAVEKLAELEKASLALQERLREIRLGVSGPELILMDQIAEKQAEINRLLADKERAGNIQKRQLQNVIEGETQVLAQLKQQLNTMRSRQAEAERLVSYTRETADAERAVWQETEKASSEAETLVREYGYATAKALDLAGVDITSPISSATREAAALAANLGVALNVAMSIQNMRSGKVYSGRGGDPRKFMNGGSGMTLAQDAYFNSIDGLISGSNSGGGGGGGGASRDFAAELEQLKEKFATETETIQSEYEKQLDLLAEFRANKVAKEQEFNELEQRIKAEHQEKLAGIEKAALDAKLAAYSGALGDMSSLMQSENKKIFAIGKAAALAEATISGYQAAVDAWQKGMKIGGPPVAAAFTAASLAKTGALISGIASQSASGGGGGAVANTNASPDAAAGSSANPLYVRMEQLDPSALVSGSVVNSLLEKLQDEAGDRGLAFI